MRKALRCTAGTLIALGLGMGLTVPARAATLAKPPLQAAPPAPCTSPELQQLDFWVGDWELTWPAHGQAPAGTGTNHVEKILGGCAVQESFAAAGPQGLVGRSMSAYNPQLKIWE